MLPGLRTGVSDSVLVIHGAAINQRPRRIQYQHLRRRPQSQRRPHAFVRIPDHRPLPTRLRRHRLQIRCRIHRQRPHVHELHALRRPRRLQPAQTWRELPTHRTTRRRHRDHPTQPLGLASQIHFPPIHRLDPHRRHLPTHAEAHRRHRPQALRQGFRHCHRSLTVLRPLLRSRPTPFHPDRRHRLTDLAPRDVAVVVLVEEHHHPGILQFGSGYPAVLVRVVLLEHLRQALPTLPSRLRRIRRRRLLGKTHLRQPQAKPHHQPTHPRRSAAFHSTRESHAARDATRDYKVSSAIYDSAPSVRQPLDAAPRMVADDVRRLWVKSCQIPVSSSQFQTVAVDVRRLWKG